MLGSMDYKKSFLLSSVRIRTIETLRNKMNDYHRHFCWCTQYDSDRWKVITTLDNFVCVLLIFYPMRYRDCADVSCFLSAQRNTSMNFCDNGVSESAEQTRRSGLYNIWERTPSEFLLLFIVYTKLTTNATWSPIGESVAGYGSVGSGAMLSLAGPGPIVFDIDNNLYVNDYGHHRVIFYPSDGGTPSVVAGIGTAGSAMNQLSSPNGIAVDSSGTLYIVSPPYSYLSALR